MAECIIARGGGGSSGTDLPPIVPGYSSILVTVRDSEGNLLPELSVHCKDGDNWYNYHTNNKGQVLFMTNSGSANITAWNFSINGNYKWIDQSPVTQNIDAPASSSNLVNINLPFQNNFYATSMSSNIYLDCFSGNYKFRVANNANLFIGGAGGGPSVQADGGIGAGGGAGGAYIVNSIKVNKNQNYQFYIGTGGMYGSSTTDGHNYYYHNGESGGSSSAFGYSATGGSGGLITGVGGKSGTGTHTCGNGGNNNSNGYDSPFNNFGGGGAGAARRYNKYGGNPYGGNSICIWGKVFN